MKGTVEVEDVLQLMDCRQYGSWDNPICFANSIIDGGSNISDKRHVKTWTHGDFSARLSPLLHLVCPHSQVTFYFSFEDGHGWNFMLRRPRGGGVRGGGIGPEAKLRLLDKFIKFTNIEGSIVAKAPFSLRVCGVFFKKDNSVYTEKNFMIGNQRERFRKDELKRNRREFPEKLKQKFIDDRIEAKEREKQAALTEEQLEEVAEKKRRERMADESILESLGDRLGDRLGPVKTTIMMTRSPIIMNIYGRSTNQVYHRTTTKR